MHLAALAGTAIGVDQKLPVVVAREEHVRILGIGRDISRLAAARAVDDRRGRAAAASTATSARATTAAASAAGCRRRFAREAHGAAVLLRAADVVRQVRRRDHVVVLRGREVLRAPARPAGHRHRAAAVVGDDQMLRIVRVDPEVVEITVRAAAQTRDGLAAVRGFVGADVQQVDRVAVLRIGGHVRVVERALANVAIRVHHRPRRAGVV